MCSGVKSRPIIALRRARGRNSLNNTYHPWINSTSGSKEINVLHINININISSKLRNPRISFWVSEYDFITSLVSLPQGEESTTWVWELRSQRLWVDSWAGRGYGKKGNGCTVFLEMITSCPARVSIFRTEAKVVKLEL